MPNLEKPARVKGANNASVPKLDYLLGQDVKSASVPNGPEASVPCAESKCAKTAKAVVDAELNDACKAACNAE